MWIIIYDKNHHALEKREKELECIYRVSDLFDMHLPISSLLKGIIQRLPNAFLYSDVAVSCIILDGKEYKSDNFKINSHTLFSDIIVNGNKRGSVNISYCEERPMHDMGPFLKEEQRLLDVITSRLCKVLERKYVEEALLDSERRHRLIFDASPIGIFVDKKGVITHCNKSFLKIFKLSHNDVMGANIFDYLDDKRLCKVFLGSSEKHLPFYENEYSAIVYGSEVYLRSYYVPIRSREDTSEGGIGLIADITANKNYEDELQNQKELLTSTFNALQDLIIVVDRNMRIVTSNWKSEEMSMPQQPGAHPDLFECFGHNLMPCDPCPVKKVFSTGNMTEFEYEDPVDKKTRDFRIFPVHDTKGDVVMAVSHIRDITVRKQTEEALKKSTVELEKAYEDLKSLDKLKDEFLSNLRHELNTPLTSIKGFSELLHECALGPLNEKQMDAIERVVAKSYKLQHLIDSLLFVSVNQNGTLKYNFEKIDIFSLLKDTVNCFVDRSIEKKITIHTDITFDSCFIEADRTYINQIFLNLLDNAVKFTDHGGNVTLEAFEEANAVHIVIGDSGIGISESNIPGLFRKFYQIDSSSTRNYGGNGLGLYISKIIVESHKGQIWIESEKGKGTDVHVLLPFEQKKNHTSPRPYPARYDKPILG